MSQPLPMFSQPTCFVPWLFICKSWRALALVWAILILLFGKAIAQTAPIQFRPVSVEPAVEVGGRALVHPWAGGMACPQWHSMDLNGDGVQERV
ncbi:MAG: hypothetical protein ACKOX4_00810, partial [Bacteroidota bacterium]